MLDLEKLIGLSITPYILYEYKDKREKCREIGRVGGRESSVLESWRRGVRCKVYASSLKALPNSVS